MHKNIMYFFSDRLAQQTAEMNRVTLRFHSRNLEKNYTNKQDSAFKFYILCAFIIFIFIATVQLIALNRYLYFLLIYIH